MGFYINVFIVMVAGTIVGDLIGKWIIKKFNEHKTKEIREDHASK